MKILKYSLLGLFLLTSIQSYGCDCHRNVSLEKMQKEAFEYSDLVFVGDVVKVDEEDGTYELEVVEVFKGRIEGNIIKGKATNSCSGIPDKGKWLIYTDLGDNGLMEISTCGPSRAFHMPHMIEVKDYPVVPEITLEERQRAMKDAQFSVDLNLKLQRHTLKINKKALVDLENEIEALRRKREK